MLGAYAKLSPLLDDLDALEAVTILRRDFNDPKGLGPKRVAEFIAGGSDDRIQADVVGFIRRLLTKIPT